MATSLDRLLNDALHLPTKERAHLVAELLATLEPAVPVVDRADEEWIGEIERRARDARSGTPGVPWPEARKRIEKRITGE